MSDFRIDFNGMNEVIGFLSRALDKNLSIEFDPQTNDYIVDGIPISINFLAETQAKMSHYINTVNRLLIAANDKYQREKDKFNLKQVISDLPDEVPDSTTPTQILYAKENGNDGKTQKTPTRRGRRKLDAEEANDNNDS